MSLNEIHEKTNIPKTTIYGWIADIPLSEEQKKFFKQRPLKLLQRGRVEAQRTFKEKRYNLQKKLFEKGEKKLVD